MTDTRQTTIGYALAETPFGTMLVAGDGRKLTAVKFNVTPERLSHALEELHHETRGRYLLVPDGKRVAKLVRQLCDYLDGRRAGFDLDIDLSWMTPGFRLEVLLETARVPRGDVASYADIARRVGRPGAFRAVGNTMRTNPIPIVIPCHRIIGSNGGLHGFGGGLDMKRRLLALEGAALAI